MEWIVEHWDDVALAIGGLWTFVSFVVSLTPTEKDDQWLARAGEWLSFLTPSNRPGTLKLPFKLAAEGDCPECGR